MNSTGIRFHARKIGIAVAIIVALGADTTSAGQECNGTSPRLCVEMDGVQPQVNVHYLLDLNAPNGPEITLIAGNTGWKVWSQVSVSDATPANIGDIKIDATIPADVFEMSLLNATGGPGAANVGSIILLDGLWTGHSSLTAGHITGNLTNGWSHPP
ncbi:MAG: hypothetical protein IH987_21800 [Planctomycetes bacterium]|nr:hypothetical protein [Planctomycetota bacterium]